MLYSLYHVILFGSAFFFGVIGTGLAYAALKHAQVMDVPNARSNHSTPTPRGGGLGIVAAVLMFLWVAGAPALLLLAVAVLTAVSFCDDIRPLPARWRLLVQLVVVAGLLATVYQGRLFPELLPRWLELPLLALAWLWFINLFNFMDGSDGLAAGEGISISAGIVLMATVAVLPGGVAAYALVVLGAVAGFILWNWHPARIFMGDVGSVPLGLLLGYMLITLAGAGYWAAALILPAVFLADATTTLLRRAIKRERIFEAHSTHAYQRAIRGGMAHNQVAGEVLAVNVVLIALAMASALGDLAMQFAALALAYGMVFLLLRRFSRYKKHSDDVSLPSDNTRKLT